MEKLYKILKYIIVGITTLILTIIIASYIGIITSIIMVLTLFIFLYFLNKKYDIQISQENYSKKINIILAIILFIIAFTIRILLVKLLQISPESDFAVLIDASKQLALRKKYIKYFLLFFVLGISNRFCFISSSYYKII